MVFGLISRVTADLYDRIIVGIEFGLGEIWKKNC